MKNKILAFMCVAALAVLPSCSSSSSSSSGMSTLNSIEQDVGLLMQVMDFLIGELDPFAVPAPFPSVAGGGSCKDVSEDNCNVSGTVEECTTGGSDIDVVFDACAADVPAIPGVIPEPFSFEITGTLTYSPLGVWPMGIRDLIYTPQGENWAYRMTFDGTEFVEVGVEDLIDGTQAICDGSLVTFTADCELIDMQREGL